MEKLFEISSYIKNDECEASAKILIPVVAVFNDGTHVRLESHLKKLVSYSNELGVLNARARKNELTQEMNNKDYARGNCASALLVCTSYSVYAVDPEVSEAAAKATKWLTDGKWRKKLVQAPNDEQTKNIDTFVSTVRGNGELLGWFETSKNNCWVDDLEEYNNSYKITKKANDENIQGKPMGPATPVKENVIKYLEAIYSELCWLNEESPSDELESAIAAFQLEATKLEAKVKSHRTRLATKKEAKNASEK